ncbi:FecR family protein [Pedobacter sp. MC2016-24]|uniref:FecR family protein n=1 Tax=Pedobacter sp. MC2016-24 TaxID=2780090 RepID=UPI00187FBCEC|nr:DUF4974 domain-containing protein [Pedobacter sp. MC2016-24]
MADALTILRKEKLKSFFIYDSDHVIGEINHEELMLFLGYGENAESIYTHKLNFDLGSALVAIARMRSQNKPIPRKNTISKKLIVTLGAAAIISTVLVGLALNFFKPLDALPEIQTTQLSGSNKVVLTLSTGAQIPLNPAKSGINLSGGFVKYSDGDAVADTKRLTGNSDAIGKNEQVMVATSNGSTYQLVLPDGTRVWLNDASTIKFAPGFDGKSPRRVELTGEAYFEVAKVKGKSTESKTGSGAVPFTVFSEGQIIEVLGTHFNVNAYQNEGDIKTTLLEGQIAVTPVSKKKTSTLDFIPTAPIDGSAGEFKDGQLVLGATKLLKPNEQSILNGSAVSVKHVDIDESIAWKNGEFIFRNMPLEKVMHVITRWYDVDVIYKNGKGNGAQLGGMISKSAKISEVLKTLELIANVHFKIDGRRVTVIQ